MFDERVLEKLFKNMNEHVPSQRPNLADLLASSDPMLYREGRSNLSSRTGRAHAHRCEPGSLGLVQIEGPHPIDDRHHL